MNAKRDSEIAALSSSFCFVFCFLLFFLPLSRSGTLEYVLLSFIAILSNSGKKERCNILNVNISCPPGNS